eukprot:m.1086798 g.1086798  ORF g.1086798 m.1086798 type:complete len:98 (-) comp24280_c0_seq23:1911-2204(-)
MYKTNPTTQPKTTGRHVISCDAFTRAACHTVASFSLVGHLCQDITVLLHGDTLTLHLIPLLLTPMFSVGALLGIAGLGREGFYCHQVTAQGFDRFCG